MSDKKTSDIEELFLQELKSRAESAINASRFRLSEEAFAIYIDGKAIDALIYQDTQQIYKDMIAKAIERAKNSYAARFEAAKILKEHDVVINNATISGVISGELEYIRAQAEYFVWRAIVTCPTSLKTISNNVHITTIPVSRFVVLHLYNYDLTFEENEYMLNKKSRNDESEYAAIEFYGETLIAGEVSAISKK
ncbi:MAG: hypothetical protein LBF86_02405 [Helicobacteraceae bacterium]|jgi:hypothetical protein|nr:hypothetical protein [Helicobacteraceae bacterium]